MALPNPVHAVVAVVSTVTLLFGLMLGGVSPASAAAPAPGEVWISRAAPASDWASVAYGNNVFVAVAVAVDWEVSIMSSPDGVTWTARQPATGYASWQGVTYGNGLFVAVASSGEVMTSPDGVTWTARTASSRVNWYSVVYGNSLFVAVAYSGNVMTSPDGVTWTARSAPASSWSSVTFGNGLFVAVANSGLNQAMTSPDGVTWTARTAVGSGWSSVTYGNGLFVSVSRDGLITNGRSDRVMTSPDGVSWTARTVGGLNWTDVTYGNGLFVAVASSGEVMTSPDGVSWTDRASPARKYWLGVAYGKGLFVAVGAAAENPVMTASNPEISTPAAPTALGVTPGDGNASVSFTAGADGGGPITNYEFRLNGSGSWIALSPSDASSPVTIPGLTNGTSYTVQLRAVNSAGAGSSSDASSSFTPRTTPSAPTSLAATPGDGSASISFTAGADGGASITKYQYKVGSGSWVDAVGTSSPLTVMGLRNFQVSGIRLRAVNIAGAGVASSSVSVTARQAGPAVTSATPSGRTGIVVTFSLNPLPGTTVAYQSVVAYVSGTNTVAGSCRTYATRTTCYIGGLTRATNYDLRVTAHLPVLGKTWHATTAEGSILQVGTNN